MSIKNIFLILIVLFGFIVKKINAQNTNSTAMDYNTQFDKVVKENQQLIISTFNSSLSKTKILQEKGFIYDPEKEYSTHFILYTFCKRDFKEKEVLKFIEDAVADPNRDIFSDIHRMKCKCVQDYSSVKEKFISYYKTKHKPRSHEQNTFLQFQVNNNLPNTLELIKEYFKERNPEEYKFWNEQNLIIRLIEIGEEREALDLMNFFYKEYIEGKISNLRFEDSMTRKNAFILLGFSENEKIAKETIEFCFQYASKKNSGSSLEVIAFLKFVDKARYSNLVKKSFYEYHESDLNDKYNLDTYVGLMTSLSTLIGDEMGKEFWEILKTNKNLVQAEYFQSNLGFIFRGIFKDPKINLDDKKEMIEYYRNNVKYISDNEQNKDWKEFQTYLHLIFLVFPEISDGQIISYMPARYENDSWYYAWRDAKNMSRLFEGETIDLELLERYQEDLMEALIFPSDFPKTISKHQLFKTQLESYGVPNQHFIKYQIQKSNKILCINFNTEFGVTQLNYAKQFEDNFLPLLENQGIHGIKVTNAVQDIEGILKHTVQVTYNNEVEGFEFTYPHNNELFDPYLLTKALNLTLINLDTKLRLVNFYTDDYTFNFGLLEPNVIFPLAIEYDLEIGAISPSDVFYAQEKEEN